MHSRFGMHVLAKSNTPTTQNKHLHKGFLLYEVFFIKERAMMNDDIHDSDDGDDDDNDHDHTDSYRESSWTSPSLRAPQMGIGSQRTHSWLQKCWCRSPRSAHIDALYEMTQHKEICNILGASSEDSEEQRKARTRSPRVHRRSPGQDRVWEEERRPPNSWMEKPRTAAAVLTWVYLELHSV